MNHASIEYEVARSLDASIELMPLVPALLADLQALGSSPDDVCAMLRSSDVSASSRAIDLGCGKGAVSLAVADAFGCDVVGVDGFQHFVDAAREAARVRGLSAHCRFECGDLRTYLRPSRAYDIVIYAAIGDLLGTLDESLRCLHSCVCSGGLLVVDDGFLRDGTAAPAGYETYVSRDATHERIASAGYDVIIERVYSETETRDANAWNTERIRSRAAALIESHPDQADAIRGFVRRQEEESELLATAFVPALWLLRKRD